MNENINEIYSLLDKKRIKEALEKIQSMASAINEWGIWDEADQLLVSYNMMLKYTMQGIKDPNMKEMISKSLSKAYNILERVSEIEKIRSSASYIAKIYNRINAEKKTLLDIKGELEKYTEDLGTADLLYAKEEVNDKKIEISKVHEESINHLFDKILTTLQWSEKDYQQAQEIIDSLLIADYDKAILISAATMSLLHVFDERKFMLLLSAYDNENPIISQRALIGLVIILQINSKRINDYPEIIGRLSILKDDKGFITDIKTIQLQFLMTRETNNIEKKMREDIIPEMIKNSEGSKYNKFLYDIEDKENENPDWEKMINDSGLGEKIKEMNDLQTSGADIYMSSFSMLKNYRFFFKMSHWFYPFFIQQYDVYPIIGNVKYEKASIFNLTLNSIFFCNSDKYSLCFTFENIPAPQKDMFISQLNDMSEEDVDKSDALKVFQKGAMKKHVISRQYIQDLYRFFKLWHYKNEEIDIFRNNFDLWNNEMLKDVVCTKKTLSQIGTFLIKYKYMEEAYQVYNMLTDMSPDDCESWQKQGYALQKLLRYEEAIDCYKKADMISPDCKWTNHHLAQCYKKSGNYSKALEYYKRIEAILPDDLSITAQIGQCLINLENYKEAQQYFFKIEYIDEGNINSKRAIGWCMLQTGNYTESEKYFLSVAKSNKVDPNDLINLGNIYLLQNKIDEAVGYYKDASTLLADRDQFINLIDDKKEFLKSRGISDEFITILPDLIL